MKIDHSKEGKRQKKGIDEDHRTKIVPQLGNRSYIRLNNLLDIYNSISLYKTYVYLYRPPTIALFFYSHLHVGFLFV